MSDTNVNRIPWNDMVLFGGAMFCKLPMGYMDLAHIRQIPDHQECFMELHLGDEREDQPSSVFIVEILEHQQSIEHDRIVEYLFRDLAESNGINDESVDGEDDNNHPRTLFFEADNSAGGSQSQRIIPPTELFHLDETTDRPPHATIIYRSGRGVQRIHRGKGNENANLETISVQMFVIRLLQSNTDLLITLTTPILRDETNLELVLQQQQQQSILFQSMISSIEIHDLSLFNP